MSTAPCKQCSHFVDSDAKRCPTCGSRFFSTASTFFNLGFDGIKVILVLFFMYQIWRCSG